MTPSKIISRWISLCVESADCAFALLFRSAKVGQTFFEGLVWDVPVLGQFLSDFDQVKCNVSPRLSTSLLSTGIFWPNFPSTFKKSYPYFAICSQLTLWPILLLDNQESTNIASLHLQIKACDGILGTMEEMLSTFQGDLKSISSEIQTLQVISNYWSVKTFKFKGQVRSK